MSSFTFIRRFTNPSFFGSRTIEKAIGYLHAEQTPEGGWVGSWGICMTYATQFALESLALVGETYETSVYSRRACEFILSHQRGDGGWGESYKVRVFPDCFDPVSHDIFGLQSCEQSRWVEHKETQVVQTCWAVMSLIHAKYPSPEPIEKAIRLVMSRQRPVRVYPHSVTSCSIYSQNMAGWIVATRSDRRSL